ncbi:MAG: hypothetical protein JF570_05880 [Caulobacter sp.]|jgi:hypothetical protein|nr:hypothetical protein [Caulobacter sp.]
MTTSAAGVDCPEAFEMTFRGEAGVYRLSYRPNADKGLIQTTIDGVDMTWLVDFVENGPDGAWELGGLTRGTEALWNDVYWFELRTTPGASLNFWGDQIIARSDPAG